MVWIEEYMDEEDRKAGISSLKNPAAILLIFLSVSQPSLCKNLQRPQYSSARGLEVNSEPMVWIEEYMDEEDRKAGISSLKNPAAILLIFLSVSLPSLCKNLQRPQYSSARGLAVNSEPMVWIEEYMNEESRKAGISSLKNPTVILLIFLPAFLPSLFKNLQSPRYSAASRFAVAMVLRWSLAVNSGWRL